MNLNSAILVGVEVGGGKPSVQETLVSELSRRFGIERMTIDLPLRQVLVK